MVTCSRARTAMDQNFFLPRWALSAGWANGMGAAFVLPFASALGFFFSRLLRCSPLAMVLVSLFTGNGVPPPTPPPPPHAGPPPPFPNRGSHEKADFEHGPDHRHGVARLR